MQAQVTRKVVQAALAGTLACTGAVGIVGAQALGPGGVALDAAQAKTITKTDSYTALNNRAFKCSMTSKKITLAGAKILYGDMALKTLKCKTAVFNLGGKTKYEISLDGKGSKTVNKAKFTKKLTSLIKNGKIKKGYGLNIVVSKKKASSVTLLNQIGFG